MTKILLAFSWGYRPSGPSMSNEILAREVAVAKAGFEYILAQTEVADALIPLGMTPDFIIGKSHVYITTADVGRAALVWMKEKGIDQAKTHIAVACHPVHWVGVRMVLRKLGVSAERIPGNAPYDPQSSQWYTRGPLRALLGKVTRGIAYAWRGEL
ncbi:MAG: hypothetical protein AAB581_01090 [Patescibacteria group bacterium]